MPPAEPNARRVVWFCVKVLRSIRYLRLCIALVLGVVTSVGVAWGVYWKDSPYAGSEMSSCEADGKTLFFSVDRWTGSLHVWQFLFESRIVETLDPNMRTQRVVVHPRPLDPHFVPFASESNELVVRSAGFPMLCVYARTDSKGTFGSSLVTREYGRLKVSERRQDDLPCAPLWGGLAVNTAFYGAAWYPVLAAPGLLLTRLRRRKGKCGACGYDMQGLAVATCPECGKAG